MHSCQGPCCPLAAAAAAVCCCWAEAAAAAAAAAGGAVGGSSRLHDTREGWSHTHPENFTTQSTQGTHGAHTHRRGWGTGSKLPASQCVCECSGRVCGPKREPAGGAGAWAVPGRIKFNLVRLERATRKSLPPECDGPGVAV